MEKHCHGTRFIKAYVGDGALRNSGMPAETAYPCPGCDDCKDLAPDEQVYVLVLTQETYIRVKAKSKEEVEEYVSKSMYDLEEMSAVSKCTGAFDSKLEVIAPGELCHWFAEGQPLHKLTDCGIERVD